MSTHSHTVSGHFHILLRCKGHAAQIRLFHGILSLTDSDWPYRLHTGSQICETCMGLVYQNPRITPEDIKSAAKQAGIHIKIKHFVPEKCCVPAGKSFPSTRWVPITLTHQLYGPHGVQTVRDVLDVEDTRNNRPLTPIIPQIIRATDTTLIATALDPPSHERVM
jgi:hypothetical protein